jgi:hypothetical protein
MLLMRALDERDSTLAERVMIIPVITIIFR